MAPNVIRPPRLRPGDTVRLVSPSGPPLPEKTEAGVSLLKSWGLQVQVSDHAFDRYGYLAGNDDIRAAEFNAALRDAEVRGLFCTRGGYGVTRMVDSVDFAAAARDPKPVVGYSDITALFNALYVHSGITGVHGPVMTTVGTGQDPAVGEALRTAVMTDEPVVLSPHPAEATGALTRGETVVSGRLLGGNLSLVVDAVGTSSCPDYDGAILFCEEVNEEPYRLDRILTQLRRAGTLDGIVGIALGQFTGCADADWDWDVLDVLRDRLNDLGVPILGGLRFGHGTDPLTVPFGTMATLDPVTRILTAGAAVG
ncbi:MAG: S66 peptidase family protein [Stackebrandtia sp.]